MFLLRAHNMDATLPIQSLKVSYSCMGNVVSISLANNRNILYPKKSKFGFNCKSRTDNPLENKRLTPKIV